MLSQFTTYRREWRNPSTHDYKLDFDEGEAFLAIVSVCAFAALLFDEIGERLAFNRSQAEVEAHSSALQTRLREANATDLLTTAANLLMEYCAIHRAPVKAFQRQSEAQLVGAIHGFLASAAPDLQVQTGAELDSASSIHADLVISRGSDRVLVELTRSLMRKAYGNRIMEVEHQLLLSGIRDAVLLYVPESPADMETIDHAVVGLGGRIRVLTPRGWNPKAAQLHGAGVRRVRAGNRRS